MKRAPRAVVTTLPTIMVGLSLALALPPSAATALQRPAQLNPSPVCVGNGFNLQGNFAYVDRDPQLIAEYFLVDGRPSQFSTISLREPEVRLGTGVLRRGTRVDLIAEGTNTVLQRVSPASNLDFMLATGRNAVTGAVNDPNTYRGQNLIARVTYDLTDDRYGRCTMTLVSNRLGPLGTTTQYSPAAPEVALAAGQAGLTPGARTQVKLVLNNSIGTAGTPESALVWRAEYGYADTEGAPFDSCAAANGGPYTSAPLDGAAAARGAFNPSALLNIDIPPNKSGKWLCVRHQVQSTLGRATSPVTYKFVSGAAVAPQVPVITMRNPGDRFEVGKEFLVT
ncbi:MAG: hypothetical protein ACKN9D_15820, partial [Actinomycetales bacterium]